MEVAAVKESVDGGGGTGNPPGGATAAPAELLKRLDAVVAETGGTSADEQPCEHFSIRGFVALQKMDPKYCSLSEIFNGQKKFDKRHSSLSPFSVSMFQRWDCSKCLDQAKISYDTTSRTVYMGTNVSRDGCSIRFVRSTKVPTSVDFRSLFPCTQQLAQGKNADRLTLLKSSPESNSKCSPLCRANTDPPTKDVQGPSSNQAATTNLSDNTSAGIMPSHEDSQIRANTEGNGITIPSSPKLSEETMQHNAEDTQKNKEVLNFDHTIPNVPKPISWKKGDQVCNSGPCEEAAPKRIVGSTCKKKKGKPSAQVGSSDVKIGRRKQIKLRLLSEIINTDPAGGSRTDIEVSAEKVADPSEDDRSTDDDISVSHQAVGKIWPEATKSKAKEKEVVDDESSLMNWMKRIPKKSRTVKKDIEQKDIDSSASKSTADLFASGWKLSKKNALPNISIQQGDENVQNNNLERNTQSTDDMIQMEAENSTDRSLLKIKPISLSKRKKPSTASVQHDCVVPVGLHAVRVISSKTAKKKAKYKGVDVVDNEGSSLMNWMKKIPKRLRTEKKDTKHKDFDSSAANSQYTVDDVAFKDVHSGFLSSVQKLSQEKVLPATSTGERDENIQNNNMERHVHNTDDPDGMCQMESENCIQRTLSKVKKVSLSKRNIPSTIDAKHGDLNIENNTVKTSTLRTDDQCQIKPINSVKRRLAKVYPGKRGIRNVTALEQKIPQKRKKQKQQLMHEKQAMIDDIPMDIVELLARNKNARPLITETDSSDISHSKSKIAEDDDCTVISAEDGPDFASNVLDTTSQKKPLAPESCYKALQDSVAPVTQVTNMHAPRLQTSSHLESTQDPQTDLRMGELVTIAATSPILSQHKDQSIAEAPADCWNHKGAKKLMWDSFEAAPRDSSTSTCHAQFRSRTDAVDLTSTHVARASYNYYTTHQPVISAPDHYTDKTVNPVQARNFPSARSTMEAGNLYDRRNAGQSGLYPRETLPATHLLRLTESVMLAGFPNYEAHNQMEFQLRNSYYAQNQNIGSASTSYGAHHQYTGSASTSYGAHHQYTGSASTSYGSNLNGIGSTSTSYGAYNQYVRSASTSHGSHLNGIGSASLSYGSNLNGKFPLTLEDLSRPRVQQNLHKPLRPLPRVGVLSSLLQKEIANLPESCGTQAGYRIGVSKGITSSFDINRRENLEALNPGMYSATWNVLQMGSGSSSPGFSSVRRNSTAQSLTRDQGRMTSPLDRLVRQDICVTNRNPTDFTTISDDNEFLRQDL